MHRRRKPRNHSRFKAVASVFKPIVTVIVLTAFILSIAYFVRGLSRVETGTLIAYADPLLKKFKINVDTEKVGEVAGGMISRINNINLGGGGSSERVSSESTPDNSEAESGIQQESEGSADSADNSGGEPLFTVGLLADSHSNYDNLRKALDGLTNSGISSFFFLGDLTELGLIEDLQSGKKVLDGYKLKYLILSGDHDLWKSVGYDNFLEVFSGLNFTKEINDTKFVLLDNSQNFSTIELKNIEWLKKEVTDADFVVLSQPLYSNVMDSYMGRIDGKETLEVVKQRNELLEIIRDSEVRAIISADLHTSSSATDPQRKTLRHLTVGALTDVRNLQSPRYSTFSVYDDGSYRIEDVVLE